MEGININVPDPHICTVIERMSYNISGDRGGSSFSQGFLSVYA